MASDIATAARRLPSAVSCARSAETVAMPSAPARMHAAAVSTPTPPMATTGTSRPPASSVIRLRNGPRWSTPFGTLECFVGLPKIAPLPRMSARTSGDKASRTRSARPYVEQPRIFSGPSKRRAIRHGMSSPPMWRPSASTASATSRRSSTTNGMLASCVTRRRASPRRTISLVEACLNRNCTAVTPPSMAARILSTSLSSR
mmetsp:Transcript_83413/g.233717  ORF Transcript_83413/g.233717 Transcript_83413/m.233717 type:complete len:202 (-) Transcript_83413:65-670(-)